MLLVEKTATRFVGKLTRHVSTSIWNGGVMWTLARSVLVLALMRSATSLLTLLTRISPDDAEPASLQARTAALLNAA